MVTTPEKAALLSDVLQRCRVVADFDGPQTEAFVSGLFPLFDGTTTAREFVDHCSSNPGPVSTLVCAAMAELAEGDDPALALAARSVVEAASGQEHPALAQIGTSTLTGAWSVNAPFGRSVLLGFSPSVTLVDEFDEARDSRHSLLVELAEDGAVVDLQLSGPAALMVDDAGAVDGRVTVDPIEIEAGLQLIIDGWPSSGSHADREGPGIAANQQFARRRVLAAADAVLPLLGVAPVAVDVQRGLDDAEYAVANRAALSTLQSALGDLPAASTDTDPAATAWVGIIRGDGGELSGRERDALLWLEWADWLGAGIGVARAAAEAAFSGSVLVDYVNRCPEVSSVIDKADREYAEWAFDVAIDVLADQGLVVDAQLTPGGRAALVPAMVQAWS